MEGKTAPPIPYRVSLLRPSDLPDWYEEAGTLINRHIDDWRLEVNFTRSVPAVLWLRFKNEFDFDPLQDLIQVIGESGNIVVHVLFRPVLPEGREVTAYEEQSYKRVNHRFVEDTSIVIPAGMSVDEAGSAVSDLFAQNLADFMGKERRS